MIMARKPQRESTAAASVNEARQGEYETRRARVARNNDEANRRMEEARPTPTQEENDRFKLGLMKAEDEKEPDGTEDQPPARKGIDAPDGSESDTRSSGSYRNRETTAE
jgi:hypothetical protein